MEIFVNFKAYPESTGRNAESLIRKIEERFTDLSRIKIVLNPLDSMIQSKMEKFIQNAEPMEAGPFTGHIPIPLLKNYGYSGVMINHSEYKVALDRIDSEVRAARKNGLRSLVCASDVEDMKNIIPLHPDYIAYEPPELIGGNISVSTAKPDIISEAVQMLKGTEIKLLVGAGIKNEADVRISDDLGANGILVASGVVKSSNPIGALEKMINRDD
jgi:triosephosphate isomerase